MSPIVIKARNFLVSLKLTVVLLVLSLLLIFAGTLAQTDLGVYAVQDEFFRSFIAIWHVGPLFVPLPGGYLVGGVLFVNLIAAHLYRFKFTWRKAGILLTHAGLIMLLVGELLTGLWQQDYSMMLVEGEPNNHYESYKDNELAIIDTTDPDFDDVVAIPEDLLKPGAAIQYPKLPFRVVVRDYHPNANLSQRADASGAGSSAAVSASPATAGLGLMYDLVPLDRTYRQDDRNLPAAYIELDAPEGILGTWLVFGHPDFPAQSFEYQGHTYRIVMRYARAYQPFSLTLLKFSHDRYAGTEIPKNFSSRVRLTTPDGSDDHDVLIYMNNPLRYEGLTFYQASYDPNRPDITILQVVRNPSRLIPYVSCILMALGLLWQFGHHLFGFVAKRRKIPSAAAT